MLEGSSASKTSWTAAWRCAIPAALRSAAPAPCRSTARRNSPVAPLSARNWASRQNHDPAPPNLPLIKDLVVDMAPFWGEDSSRDTLADAGHPSHKALRAIRATAVAAGDLPISQRGCLHYVRACVAACTLTRSVEGISRSSGAGQGSPICGETARTVGRQTGPALSAPGRRRDLGLYPLQHVCRSVPKTSNRWRRSFACADLHCGMLDHRRGAPATSPALSTSSGRKDA